jgi:hypothetical protein
MFVTTGEGRSDDEAGEFFSFVRDDYAVRDLAEKTWSRVRRWGSLRALRSVKGRAQEQVVGRTRKNYQCYAMEAGARIGGSCLLASLANDRIGSRSLCARQRTSRDSLPLSRVSHAKSIRCGFAASSSDKMPTNIDIPGDGGVKDA